MPMFKIIIGPRGAPRLSFEVSAASAFQAQEQHVDLAQSGERVDVQPVQADQPAAEDGVLVALRCAGAI